MNATRPPRRPALIMPSMIERSGALCTVYTLYRERTTHQHQRIVPEGGETVCLACLRYLLRRRERRPRRPRHSAAQLSSVKERAQVMQRSGSRETVSGKPLPVHHRPSFPFFSVARFIPISPQFVSSSLLSQIFPQCPNFFKFKSVRACVCAVNSTMCFYDG